MIRNLFAMMLFMTLTASGLSRAASQDECAIWLCLPLGFAPSDCDGPVKAMLKRLAHIPPKGPLPPFSSCDAAGKSNGMDYQRGIVGVYFHDLKIDYFTPCLPAVNEIPGCIPYRIMAVMRDGVMQGEPYLTPLKDGEAAPSFLLSEFEELR